jgi:hypothetical protein
MSQIDTDEHGSQAAISHVATKTPRKNNTATFIRGGVTNLSFKWTSRS